MSKVIADITMSLDGYVTGRAPAICTRCQRQPKLDPWRQSDSVMRAPGARPRTARQRWGHEVESGS